MTKSKSNFGASCPQCGWRLPVLAGEKRDSKTGFTCPDCESDLRYNANIGKMGMISGGGGGTLLLIAFLAFGPSDTLKLVAGIGAGLIGVALLYVEKLELVAQDNSS